MFWKACNKQNTWECGTCAGCISKDQPLMVRTRTRSWSGDSQNHCVWSFDAGSGHETCRGKIWSTVSSTRAEGTWCCRGYRLDSDHNQWTGFPQEGHDQRWTMGLWLWPGNEGPVIPMEVTWLSAPEEGTAKSQQDQNHVNCVFWLGRWCPSWVDSTPPGQTINKEYYLNILLQLREEYHGISHSYRQLMIDSFAMTSCPLMHHVLCRVYWQNIKLLRWLSRPTAEIWHPATSGFSQTKITFEREEISDHWWDSGKYNEAADGDSNTILQCLEQRKRYWENCVRSQGAYFQGEWDPIVLCILSLVSCIFFNKCLCFSYDMGGPVYSRQTSACMCLK